MFLVFFRGRDNDLERTKRERGTHRERGRQTDRQTEIGRERDRQTDRQR